MPEYRCTVCGADLGWDRPSAVCSVKCLRRGQQIGGEYENAANLPAELEEEWRRCGLPVVDRCKREILADIASGRVPATVTTFSELHDFVDANEYGGACEKDKDGIGWWDGDDQWRDAAMTFWNRVQNEVHEWLQKGRHDATA